MLQIKSSGFPKRPLRRKFWSPLSQRKISIHPSRARFHTLKVWKLLLSPPRMQGETKGNNSVERNIKEKWQDLLSKGNPPSKGEERNTLGEMHFHLLWKCMESQHRFIFYLQWLRSLSGLQKQLWLSNMVQLKLINSPVVQLYLWLLHLVFTAFLGSSFSRQSSFISLSVLYTHITFLKSPSCTLNILEIFLLVVAPFKLIGLPSKWNISKLFCYSPRKFPFRHNHLSFLNSI